jgi:hypothetical protein
MPPYASNTLWAIGAFLLSGSVVLAVGVSLPNNPSGTQGFLAGVALRVFANMPCRLAEPPVMAGALHVHVLAHTYSGGRVLGQHVARRLRLGFVPDKSQVGSRQWQAHRCLDASRERCKSTKTDRRISLLFVAPPFVRPSGPYVFYTRNRCLFCLWPGLFQPGLPTEEVDTWCLGRH